MARPGIRTVANALMAATVIGAVLAAAGSSVWEWVLRKGGGTWFHGS